MRKWKIQNSFKPQGSDMITDDIISCLLKNRGLKTQTDIDAFLNPTLKNLNSEKVGIKRKEVKKALDRIDKSIKNKELIIIYTDYDADGICGGAILWETLYRLGAKVIPYVPHRIDEGYGLSKKGIDRVKEKHNAGLIITVDHGISSFEKIDYAKGRGIDVIITDHHILPNKTPRSAAIIHSTKLSGSGVALLFSREIVRHFKREKPQQSDYLDLVALATIADLVPLIGPNRALVKFGLKKLNQTSRIGLLALIEESGLTKGQIDTWGIGHVLAPRINAVGRLSHALDALRLLCTKDVNRAKNLAQKLGSVNKERQEITQEAFFHIQELLEGRNLTDERLIFVHHESYQEGIIGLMAGKLVERFYRPAIVLARRKQYSRASARSINGFNIFEAIQSCSDLLVDCGGHPMAAGFTVETKNLDILEKRLLEIATRQLKDEMLTKELIVDCEIPLNIVSWDLLKKIKKFEPFGLGNPQPVFVSRNIAIGKARLVGSNRAHLKLHFTDYDDIDVIGFNKGKYYPQLTSKLPVDIAYTVSENTWNGKTHLQLKLKDLKIPS